MLDITETLSIADREIREFFKRASGPGGQNVNKVETAVQLRFHVMKSPSLPPEVKTRLARLAGRRLTKDGELVIDAHRFRTQEKNREDARARLLALLRRAATPPRRRVATRTPAREKAKRLDDKRRQSRLKSERARRED